MQQKVSPKMLISVIAAAVIVLGILIVRTMTAPSSVPAAGVDTKAMRNPHAGGDGPTEEDLKRMRDYNAAHPGAASSQR